MTWKGGVAMKYHAPVIITEELFDVELGGIQLFGVQCRYGSSFWPYPNSQDGVCKNNQET